MQFVEILQFLALFQLQQKHFIINFYIEVIERYTLTRKMCYFAQILAPGNILKFKTAKSL